MAALVFLFFFSPAHPSPSLSCLRRPYSYFLFNTCPSHFNLLSRTFLDISPTFAVPLILSFLILSNLVTPLIHLNFLISATSNFFCCAFFTAHVSAPYIIAGQLSCIGETGSNRNIFQINVHYVEHVALFINYLSMPHSPTTHVV